eukprot:TRINITY_DN1710_c0_g3_i2.p1 TRINITY_DN1710_c0_g3~~TRINITY_DN1710_c0_g3_i2.p1  ORF type:complete len:427 (+),score=90.28 TRINITY_DN1710_c0_g3_i2:49-1329(+)
MGVRQLLLIVLVALAITNVECRTIINLNFNGLARGLPVPSTPSPAPTTAPTSAPTTISPTTARPTTSPTSSPTSPAPTGIQSYPASVKISELPTGIWAEIAPGGSTVCAVGAPYTFFVKRGDPENVLLDFQGGGACFDINTCTPPNDDIYLYNTSYAKERLTRGPGLYNASVSPYASWTHVYISYCTADLNIGNASVVYGNYTLRFNGYANILSVYEWVRQNIVTPSKTLNLIGCSAGGYTAFYTYELWRTLFSHIARVSVFSDSAMGIGLTFRPINAVWNFSPTFPYNLSVINEHNSFVTLMSTRYPRDVFALYTHFVDSVQIQFSMVSVLVDPEHALTSPLQWPPAALREIAQFNALPNQNVKTYLDGGEAHCQITSSNVYNPPQSGNVSLIQWISDLSVFKPVSSVDARPVVVTPSVGQGSTR